MMPLRLWLILRARISYFSLKTALAAINLIRFSRLGSMTMPFKVTTEDFIKYLHENLHKDNPDALTRAELDAWVYGPGLPDTARKPQSSAFAEVDAQSADWFAGKVAAKDLKTDKWSTHEWLHFINELPDGMTTAQYDELDAAFSLTGAQNAETAFAWYMQAIKGGYEEAFPEMQAFLQGVGRGKFIYRLYGCLLYTSPSPRDGLLSRMPSSA